MPQNYQKTLLHLQDHINDNQMCTILCCGDYVISNKMILDCLVEKMESKDDLLNLCDLLSTISGSPTMLNLVDEIKKGIIENDWLIYAHLHSAWYCSNTKPDIYSCRPIIKLLIEGHDSCLLISLHLLTFGMMTSKQMAAMSLNWYNDWHNFFVLPYIISFNHLHLQKFFLETATALVTPALNFITCEQRRGNHQILSIVVHKHVCTKKNS